MPTAALVALALAAQGAAVPSLPAGAEATAGGGVDPCRPLDARGRPFRTCFDPGNRLDLSAGAAFGDEEPAHGGANALGVAYRWRRDLRSRSGDLEWLRDMTFLEGRALFTSGEGEPRAARALAWRGVFVRHRASPFLLVPGPRPLRLPFPFDVGLAVEVAGASWERARPRDAELVPIRSALLLDLGGHGRVRRLAFGPEVAWTVRVSGTAAATHALVPFTAAVLDLRAESRDGLALLALTARGGSSLAVPGGADGFVEVTLAVERVVLAVNDRPVALYAEGAFRGGASRGGAELGVGLRAGLGR